jgi:hypothetical protein
MHSPWQLLLSRVAMMDFEQPVSTSARTLHPLTTAWTTGSAVTVSWGKPPAQQLSRRRFPDDSL